MVGAGPFGRCRLVATCYTGLLNPRSFACIATILIDVHLYMEKGMTSGWWTVLKSLVPSALVVRDACGAKYFATIPECLTAHEAQPEDPIWQLPTLHESYGSLTVPGAANSPKRSRGEAALYLRQHEWVAGLYNRTTLTTSRRLTCGKPAWSVKCASPLTTTCSTRCTRP